MATASPPFPATAATDGADRHTFAPLATHVIRSATGPFTTA
jgi:hypothetical protein